MHSFVLVSQHHHHEYPSQDWFSTHLIVLQLDNDSKATLENYDTEQYHYQVKRIYYWQHTPPYCCRAAMSCSLEIEASCSCPIGNSQQFNALPISFKGKFTGN